MPSGASCFNDKGTPKTLLQLIREKNAAQGKDAAPRADMRMGVGPDGQLFILNKRDGVVRLIVPDSAYSIGLPGLPLPRRPASP